MPSRLTKAQRRVLIRSGYAGGRKMRSRMTIKKGDTVLVRTGASAGQRGTVLQVLRDENRVIVENVAMVTRHQRRQAGVLQSETIEKASPVHRANVMVICPDCDEPTKVGHSTLQNGDKVRSCRRCGATLDKES
jgi:large subunit ribosomal protein L24